MHNRKRFKWIIPITLILFIAIASLIPGFSIATSKIKRKGMVKLQKVKLGDTYQWVLIRTHDLSNPVILFIHGGPGTSQLTQNKRNTRDLEKYFTVVNWDQRGAGKSYSAIKDKSTLKMDQFVSDTIELSAYLAARFDQDKIILVGHSWGSAVGMKAIAQKPELFHAYVGIGQVSDMIESERLSHAWTLEQAIKRNDTKAEKTLRSFGSPPYSGDWRSKFMKQRQLLGKYGGEYYGSSSGAFGVVLSSLIFSTEYTLPDRINFFRGIFASVKVLFPQLLTVNLFEEVPEVEVPVWFMLGKYDYEVPSELSAKYYSALKSPYKKLYWFDRSAHMPNTEERDRFNKILIEDILPFVKDNER